MKPFHFDLFLQSGVAHKIDIRIQPGLQTLQELIDAGLSGTFDFVFLDADKTDYPNYLNLCLPLLRTGGVLAADNVRNENHHLGFSIGKSFYAGRSYQFRKAICHMIRF